MGAAEILTAYIEPRNYEQVAKAIYNKIQSEKSSLGSKIIKHEIGLVKIEADVSTDEEDFEHYQADQLKLNSLYLTDKNGFSVEGEEEIADLVEEMLATYNEQEAATAQREYEHSDR